MKKENARETALDLLLRIDIGGAYLDRLLASPDFRNLDSRDRSFARELISGVERWKLRLDRIVDRYYTRAAKPLSPEIRNILRLGLYQIMFMDSVPARAAVNESVEMAIKVQGRGAGGLVNAILRRYTREGEPADWPSDSAERLSVQYSYPLWIARRWVANFGVEDAEPIMRAGNEKHPVFVRVNLLKTNPESLSRLLEEQGYSVSQIPEMPGYLSLFSAEGVFDTDAFQAGLFNAQDPSAGLASLLLAPLPGERVLDLCAAPGGKATHLAELMGDAGRITAVDIHPGRLRLVRTTAERLGISSVTTVVGDARSYGEGERYDRVLLDAPCMGTAVFSKRPDMKWSRNEEDIPRLTALQKEMLDNAASLIKPEGRLVYSTCSLEPEENTEQVDSFLDRHPDFEPEYDNRFEQFQTEHGYLVFPHRMHGTGAFASRMKRV
ncbi:MAG: 16S rRNA (cytosine(967)-C(5))-methyltransferase RsmB [Candidatus Latescibacterota bacterium]